VQYGHPRIAQRHSFVVDIEVTDVQSGIQIRERTRDVSLFGCGVDTLKPFPQGTPIRIKLSHGGADVAALARVAYASPELGMGVVFTSIERGDKWILEGWITELLGNQIQKQ
jgi:hypothetical protein